MKKLLLLPLLFITVISFGQGTINFNPSNPAICLGDNLTVSAQLQVSQPPALVFPYSKDIGTEIFVSPTGDNSSGDGSELNPYQTIQFGISAATNGNLVTLLPGTYSGSGNIEISPQGKQITIQSQDGPLLTTIDCGFNGRAFLVNQGESMNTIIKGFEIRNGKNIQPPIHTTVGSAIFVEDNSGILIKDCFFTNNQEGCIRFGDNETSGPQSGVENCFFRNNLGFCINSSKKSFYVDECLLFGNEYAGGNGHVANPPQQWSNCMFVCNTAQNSILGLGHGKTVINSVFVNNTSLERGVVYCGTNWSGLNTVDHCTFYNNNVNYYSANWGDHQGQSKSSIYYPGEARDHVSANQGQLNFSNSLGDGISGNGNIQGNPLFVAPNNFDFNLAAGSPCIGTGISGSDMGANMNQIPSWMFNFLEHYSGNYENVLWANGETNDTIIISPSQSQYIRVSFTDNGCGQKIEDSIWVEVNHLPTVDAGTFQQICDGDTVTLSGTGAATYAWDNGQTDGTEFTPTTTTLYTVIGTDANGCIDSDTVSIGVWSLPTVDAGADQTICSGNPVTISGNGATSYTWDNGVSDGVAFTPLSTATYTVTGTDGNGCENTDQVVVNVNTLPAVSGGLDVSVCIGDSAVLNGSGAVSYTWDNGITDGVQFVPLFSNTYTVTGTDGNGCENTDQVAITVNSLPTVGAGTDQTVCEGDPVTLSGTGASSFTWDNGVSDGVAFNATTTTTYTVTGTDVNGCENTDDMLVTVTSSPNVVAVAAADSVCVNWENVTLSGSPEGGVFSGNSVSGNRFYPPVAGVGSHVVVYSYTDPTTGCVGTDSLTIVVEECTGITENGLSNLTIYPNPTSDQITIDIKGYNGVVNVKVYDLQGRLLETTTNTIVSLKKHAKGIYVLKVSYGEVTEEVRVVRE